MKMETRNWTHSGNVTGNSMSGWFLQYIETSRKQHGCNVRASGVAARTARAAGGMHRATVAKCALFLAVFVCILALCGCEQEVASATTKPMTEAPVEVQAVHPHRGEVYRFINLPGEVRPLYEVTLFTKVNGYLETLAVDKGDAVKAGDLIANIDVPELRANLTKYKAELELAQAEYKQLSEASKNDTANSETANRLAVATGKLAVAKGNVQYTESMLKYARVTAPFDGVITHRYVDPGAYIPVPDATSTPEAAAIVNLTNFKTLRLQVAVPETEATHIKIGQPIRWTADDYPGQNFDGKVTRAYWALDKATKTMLTETQMANPGMKLQPGMLVNARIAIEKKDNALLVPVGALVKEKTNSFVFIANDGKLKKAQVSVGFNDGTNAEIVAGITPGDLAIVPGQQTLRDGQLVKVRETK
jgi:RND family efflux transporter MFP subunit